MISATYADANGDGMVDEKDVIGIGVNWDRTHEQLTQSHELDPDYISVLKQYEDRFQVIYNSLSGESEAMNTIKALLQSIIDIVEAQPRGNVLYQNFPNPFNQYTTISFLLSKEQPVALSINNILGQTIVLPIDGTVFQPGRYSYCMKCPDLPSGVYFYCLETPNGKDVRMMMLGK